MKTLYAAVRSLQLTAIFLLLIITAHAQFSASMRLGWASKSKQPFVAPALHFKMQNNVSIGAEMIVNTGDDQPVDLGLRFSYQYKFIEAGAAPYYELYSTDAYDANRNSFETAWFVAVHHKIWFVQYEYLHGNRYSFGLRANL
jgi:hypothetical protein